MCRISRNVLCWIFFQWIFYRGVSMEIKVNLYTKFAGNDLRGGSYLVVYQQIRIMICALRCSQLPECRSFTFSPQLKVCFLYDKRIHDFGTYLAVENIFDHYSEVQDKVTDGDWELVFRGESGNGVQVSDVWTSTTADNPLTINPHCFSMLKHHIPCGNHFKTSKMFIWNFAPIQRVKLNFYKSINKVVEMVFNGVDSTADDWFTPSRLLSSNWTDLATTDTSFFSINGQANRRFYTTTESNLYNCDTSFGWTVIVNSEANFCDFDKNYEEPAFLYSSAENKTIFETEASEADVMAVFISMV